MNDPEPAADPIEQHGGDTSGLATPNAGEPELLVVPGPAEAASLAAERIVAALRAAAEARGRADFCTTGGSTPIPIYRLLARAPLRNEVPWERVHVWWGDDRFVPRDHPESNVLPLDQVLLRGAAFTGELGDATGTDVESERDGAPLPLENIHPFPVEPAIAAGRDTGWCATRYAAEMASELAVDAGNWPVFDLILVGVGDDGHVLSCFPGSPALESTAWAMGIPAPTHIGPHLDRVTLNPRILEAGPVLVVTTGPGKAEALGHVFGEVRDGSRWPVQRTRRPGATWIVDEAAAARIPDRLRG